MKGAYPPVSLADRLLFTRLGRRTGKRSGGRMYFELDLEDQVPGDFGQGVYSAHGHGVLQLTL